MEHIPIIIIVSGYNHGIKSSKEDTDQREWVPNSMCEKPMRYSLKESVTVLKVIRD